MENQSSLPAEHATRKPAFAESASHTDVQRYVLRATRDGFSSIKFALPREHGALVIFILSALLALRIATCPAMICSLVALALVLMSVRRPTQGLVAGMLAAILLMVFHQIVPSLAIFNFALGSKLLNDYGKNIETGLLHDLAVLGLAGIPLFTAAYLTDAPFITVACATAFVGATLLATAIVQLRIDSAKVNPSWAFFGSCALFLVPGCYGQLTLVFLCSAPFMVEMLWLVVRGDNKPSFKVLGIVQTIALVFATLSIATYRGIF